MSSRVKHNNKGFTLIELVFVIVVLGIIAVTVTPKFMGLSKDARVTVLTQFKVSVKAANDLLFLKSKLPSYTTFPVTNRTDLIDIDMDQDGIIDLDGVDVRLMNSYLDNHEVYKQVEVSESIKLSGSKIFEEQGINLVFIGYDFNDSNQVSDDNCYFSYEQASSEEEGPTYEIVDDGC